MQHLFLPPSIAATNPSPTPVAAVYPPLTTNYDPGAVATDRTATTGDSSTQINHFIPAATLSQNSNGSGASGSRVNNTNHKQRRASTKELIDLKNNSVAFQRLLSQKSFIEDDLLPRCITVGVQYPLINEVLKRIKLMGIEHINKTINIVDNSKANTDKQRISKNRILKILQLYQHQTQAISPTAEERLYYALEESSLEMIDLYERNSIFATYAAQSNPLTIINGQSLLQRSIDAAQTYKSTTKMLLDSIGKMSSPSKRNEALKIIHNLPKRQGFGNQANRREHNIKKAISFFSSDKNTQVPDGLQPTTSSSAITTHHADAESFPTSPSSASVNSQNRSMRLLETLKKAITTNKSYKEIYNIVNEIIRSGDREQRQEAITTLEQLQKDQQGAKATRHTEFTEKALKQLNDEEIDLEESTEDDSDSDSLDPLNSAQSSTKSTVGSSSNPIHVLFAAAKSVNNPFPTVDRHSPKRADFSLLIAAAESFKTRETQAKHKLPAAADKRKRRKP